MAEHVLETRIQLRYATYQQWMNSHIILKQGEAAIATFNSFRTIENSSNSTPENTPPAVGIKIGDGQHYFSELPWVQAISADVYNWAKSSTKPTYTASEISGLDAYIEEHSGGSGSGSGTSVSRQYQIIRGTDDNINKYYLRYKNDEDTNWTIDTNHYIDVDNYEKVMAWIGTDMNNYPNLRTRTGLQMLAVLETLTQSDAAVSNQFVTAVPQTNGLVSIQRAQPSFSNLSGHATVEQGGTGRTSFPVGEVLMGNGASNISTVQIADEIAANTKLVPNYLIKSYVDNAVAGLEGAMHFRGDATVEPSGANNPKVPDYDFSQALPGDVVAYGQKEYVWTGSYWRLWGDEGSYAVKGSIKDADIDTDANIQQSKIALLAETFNTKVDKVEGKTLSSNDYSDEDKEKLTGIEAGAQRNTIEHIFVNDIEQTSQIVNNLPHSIDIHVKENVIETVFLNDTQVVPDENKRLDLNVREYPASAAEKLSTIAKGADVSLIQHIEVNGTEITPDENKVVSIHTDPHTEHINKIESIYINDMPYPPNAEKEVRITLDQAALNLSVLEGAIVPDGNGGTELVDVNTNKQLQLAAIAKSGNVKHLLQTENTYIIFDCGTSTEVV